MKGVRCPHLKEAWEAKNGPLPIDVRIKVSDTTLFECFKMRSSGATVEEVALKFDISRNWLQNVFIGWERPKLLAIWLGEGNSDFQEIAKFNIINHDRGDRPIRFSDGKEFKNLKEASKYYEVSVQSIHKALAKGYKVKGLTVTDIESWVPKRTSSSNHKCRPILCSDGREFPSAKAAADAIGVHENTLGRYLSGKRKHPTLEFKYKID
jgi:hypothetical protein